MTRSVPSSLALVLGLATAAAIAASEPAPPLVPFGGVVLAPDGAPLEGPVALTFALYAEVDDVVPAWIETQVAELGRGGSYHVALGSETPGGVPVELITTGRARWIGVRVDGGDELPRQFLGSVGFALRAADAEALDGLPAAAFLRAEGGTGAGHPPAPPTREAAPRSRPEGPPHASASPPDPIAATPALEPDRPGDSTAAGERRAAAPAVAGALLSVSGAIGAEKLIYSTPRTHYVTVVPAALMPRNNSDPYQKALTTGEAFFTENISAGFVAPVEVPDGAVIDQLRANVRDNAAGDLEVTLFRWGVGGSNQLVGSVDTTGVDPAQQELSLALNHTVTKENFGYYVTVFSSNWPGTNALAAFSVQVRYTLAEAP